MGVPGTARCIPASSTWCFMSLNSSSSNGSDMFDIAHASVSDLGMRRQNNQDAIATLLADRESWHERGHFFMVADGMGAHAAGELASQIAVENVPHTYQKLHNLLPPAALRQAVHKANELIHSKGQSSAEFNGMGTTCSCLVLLPGMALVAHVGDSRVYRLRSGQLEQLTFDHSLVWEMAAANQSSADEVPACIPKNVITRSLGPHPMVNVDLEGPYQVLPGDVFLACSDGLTTVVEDRLIGSLIQVLPPQEAVETLIDVANLRGGPDNISIVVARVPGGVGDELATEDQRATVTFNPKHSVWASLIGWFAGSNNRSTTVNNLGGPYGNGPYRFYECDAEAACRRLAELVADLQALESAADSPLANRRQIDWEGFRAGCQTGDEAVAARRFSEGIVAYSGAIRRIMTQVRASENEDTAAHVPAAPADEGTTVI
jgi:PPM family protein phosphatase